MPTAPTQREASAAHRLGEAILELLAAVEEGNAARRPLPSPQPARPAVGAARPAPPEPHRVLLSTREAAKALSIGQRLLWEMTAPRGPIPVVRLGTRVLYPLADLEAAVNRMRAE